MTCLGPGLPVCSAEELTADWGGAMEGRTGGDRNGRRSGVDEVDVGTDTPAPVYHDSVMASSPGASS